MNKHFLKNIRDNIPEPLKYITAPIFRNKLLNNKDFKYYFNLLENSKSFSADKLKEYQLNQLKSVLDFSYKNIPYYTELFDSIAFDHTKISSLDDIQIIPFLTKEIIKENFEKLTSKNKVAGGYYVATTGGSTGEPLKVLLDYNSIFKENAFVYHFRKGLNYEFSDNLATFRGVEFGDKLWKYNPMHNELVFSPFKLSKVTIKKYVDEINNYNPQYLNGYLSCLYLFAKLLEENNIKHSLKLKGIFLISENIDNDQRNFLEAFFGIKTSTFYGHSERCVIAEEEVKGLYKVSPYYGYTELIKQVESYEIVSTGFLNRTMPLIRYKTGDTCRKQNDLIAIQGRWHVDDYLLGVNNEKIFHSAFNFHSEIFKNVTNYQFLQEERGKSKLLLLVNNDFRASELDYLKREIDKKTKGIIEFNVKVVDNFLLTPRGKFKRFITSIKQN